jgi:hypothetical protein
VNGAAVTEPSSRRVGRHRLIAKLEQGGMAEVYLAVLEDRFDTGALRVVKIMPRSLASDPAFVDMFLDEARLAMRLGHPNIVQTIEVGRTSDESLFLSMEWLEGASLYRVVQRARELADDIPPAAIMAIMLPVLDALHYLHGLCDLDGEPLDVVHRDVTPSNIFLTTAGHVKLIDFGVARTSVQSAITVVGTRKGKVGYLAPEVLAGHPFDMRSDLYSAGVVLWELLAGRRLWRGRTFGAANRAAPRLDPKEAPHGLADVCARALATDPADRYPSAGAMREDLERASTAIGGPMRPSDLAVLVEQLLGEDVRHIRRVAANAVRSGREDKAGERMTRAPEGTSVTVRPVDPGDRRRLLLGICASLAAGGAMLAIGLQVAGEGSRPAQTVAVEAAEPLRETMRLEVTVTPPDATVHVDGVSVPGPPHVAVLAADGSQHVVTISAPRRLSRELRVAAAGDIRLDVVLEEERVEPPVTVPSAMVPPTAAAAPVLLSPRAPPPPAVAPSVAPPPSPRPRFGVRVLDPSDPW